MGRPADRIGGHAKAALVVAAVVDRAGRIDPGELVGLDHVHGAQLDRVQAETASELVHQALVGEVHLRLPVPSVRPDRGLVRDDHSALDEAVVDLVRPVEHDRRELRRPEGGVQAAEVVGVHVGHRNDAAVGLRSDAVVVDGLARVRGCAEVLEAILDEPDGPDEGHGVQAGEEILGVDPELQPEAAANVGRDDPDRLLAEAERLGQLLADEVRDLGRHVDVERARAGSPLREHGSRLHRQAGHAVDDEATGHDDVRVGETRLDVARALRVADEEVRVEHVGVDDRSAGRQRRGDVAHVRQGLVLDLEQVERVLCDVPASGGDADDGLALVRGDVVHQRPMRDRRCARDRAEDADRLGALGDVAPDEDVIDAVEGSRLGGVDAQHPGVRERAAGNGHLDHVGPIDVVGELAGAPEQPVVLLARREGADDAVLAVPCGLRWPRRDVGHRPLPPVAAGPSLPPSPAVVRRSSR